MRPYEVMVILDASLEEDAVRALVDRFTKQLEAAGAKALSTDKWGKRRLAYPVKHRNEGYYVVFEANAEAPAMADLDRQLRLADEVIRHKVIRLPERAVGRSPKSQAAPSAKSEAGAPSADGAQSPDLVANTNGA